MPEATSPSTLLGSIGDDVKKFAELVILGAMANERELLISLHAEHVKLQEAWSRRTAWVPSLLTTRITDRDPVPDMGDPTLLRYSIQQIDDFAAGESEPERRTGVVVHLTCEFDRGTRIVSGKPFADGFTISGSAQAAVATCGYSSWSVESLKKVFGFCIDSYSCGLWRYFEDEDLKAISSPGVCQDHGGQCRQLALWSPQTELATAGGDGTQLSDGGASKENGACTVHT